MNQVRREIADDMEDVVESARQMTDWRSYVNRYPLACAGAAALVGFILVPKRVEVVSPDVNTLLRMAKRNKLVVQTNAKAQAKTGLVGTLAGLAGSALVRGAMHLASQQVGKAVSEASQRTSQQGVGEA